MSVINDYYNKKTVPFRMAGRRSRKTVPLLENIHGKRILDVGCASGYIGEILKKQGNYVMGLDLTKKDIFKAKRILDDAMVFDIETDDIKKLGKNYDLIIIVEVVEHLFDPEAAIKRLLPVLKNGGRILVSTPNIVHIYNRVKLILGIFNYRDETIINKSHIHFFTDTSLKKMMTRLGLKLVQDNHVIQPIFLESVLKIWPNMFAGQMVSLYEK